MNYRGLSKVLLSYMSVLGSTTMFFHSTSMQVILTVFFVHVKSTGIQMILCSDERPDLWIRCLEFCARDVDGSSVNDRLVFVMREITRRGLLSEIELIGILADTCVNLGMIRPFLQETMDRNMESVSAVLGRLI